MLRNLFLCLVLFTSIQFAEAQILSHVEFRKQADKEVQVIQLGWSEIDKQNWIEHNEGRLDVMGVKTNILSGALQVSSGETTSFQFALHQQSEIEILFNVESISAGEKLFLKNNKTGVIIFEIPRLSHQQVLTPSFDPDQVYLEWSGQNHKVYKSLFSIENVYVHNPAGSRGRAIGFGTALPCHPNAACKQDSLLKILSNTAVRIRMVMEEGIGWCSGSFMNNTRNDRAPFILTAYHCTFEYTPKYNLWRFDLDYKSDSCANPSLEPQIISFTGCTLKAAGQGSDFLLVLLDNDVPINQEITFAGWNRDTVALPDTLYLIHHPNADIRKISTCSTGAIIFPNQISWSEGAGYHTPAKHHFSFKFTEGGHQPGSSGGPLFNKKGNLIAQIHGGTMGCETTNHAFAGRFAKSWNYGGTAAQRLKDWLDPDQTGVMQWPSLVNVEQNNLVDIQGQVSDPSGHPVKNVRIVISGSSTDTLYTDDQGQFNLSNINRTGQYTITPKKDDHQTNGVNVIDLVAIQKHLLAKDTFDFPWQHIAADATNNNSVAVGDFVLILRLLLGKITYYPTSPSWRFDPPVIELQDLPQGLPSHVQFTAIKIGDVNGSADPLK
ncbi:MAG TPA: carboxypeptidase regulatory-like domain-containing protein [Saprospiraceae bacterium]|nr:carboxypeptidase regulatory-like domain-containing protein [Saprospiraceae bacterium]